MNKQLKQLVKRTYKHLDWFPESMNKQCLNNQLEEINKQLKQPAKSNWNSLYSQIKVMNRQFIKQLKLLGKSKQLELGKSNG